MLRSRSPRLATAACLLVGLIAALPASASAKPLFGFNDAWTNTSSTLPLATSFGASTERIFVPWHAIETSPHRYSWGWLDGQYGAMVRAGQRPLFAVNGGPAYTKPSDCTDLNHCFQSPAHDGDYAAFLKALVARYPRAQAIEIGNEENLSQWWYRSDPVRYAEILKVAHQAIKSVNPSMPVVIGGLCTGATTGNGAWAATDFLRGMYAAGAKGNYDGIGYHVYFGGPVNATAKSVAGAMDALRSVRDANGDSTPFWITEFGFPSSPANPGDDPVSEAGQAPRLAIAYRALVGTPDVAAMYIFSLTDYGGVVHGIYRQDLSPKPAVAALRAAMLEGPWPTYDLHLVAPPSSPSLVPFHVKLTGYTASGPAVYRWMYWWPDARHPLPYRIPLATTTTPEATLTLKRRTNYTLVVEIVTATDDIMSPRVPFTVTDPPRKPVKKKHKKPARRHAKKHKRAKRHAKRRAARRHARR